MQGKQRSPVLDLAPSAGFEQDHAAVVADIVYNELTRGHSFNGAKAIAKANALAWRVVGLGIRLDLARVCLEVKKQRLGGK